MCDMIPVAEVSMQKDPVERLVERRAKLALEIEKIDAAIDRYNSVKAEIERFVDQFVDDNPGAVVLPVEWTPDVRSAIEKSSRGGRGPNGSSPEDIAGAALVAILAAGEPLNRYELIEPIEKMGLVIGGQDKARNLGTIMWRSKQFINTGAGYWPRDQLAPPRPEI
jgi:hypothetical protein